MENLPYHAVLSVRRRGNSPGAATIDTVKRTGYNNIDGVGLTYWTSTSRAFTPATRRRMYLLRKNRVRGSVQAAKNKPRGSIPRGFYDPPVRIVDPEIGMNETRSTYDAPLHEFSGFEG